MAQSAGLLVTILFGVWVAGVSIFMLAAPRQALKALSGMAGTPTIHFGELGLRLLAGVAFILAGDATGFPVAFRTFGAFLAVSAVVLMVLPRPWHAAYARWWAKRTPVWAVRASAPVSLIGSGVLIWAAMSGA